MGCKLSLESEKTIIRSGVILLGPYDCAFLCEINMWALFYSLTTITIFGREEFFNYAMWDFRQLTRHKSIRSSCKIFPCKCPSYVAVINVRLRLGLILMFIKWPLSTLINLHAFTSLHFSICKKKGKFLIRSC